MGVVGCGGGPCSGREVRGGVGFNLLELGDQRRENLDYISEFETTSYQFR